MVKYRHGKQTDKLWRNGICKKKEKDAERDIFREDGKDNTLERVV